MEEKGLWHFVMVRGVLGWGLPMSLVMGIWRWSRAPGTPTPEEIAFIAVLCTVGGLFWGVCVYKITGWTIRRQER